MWSSYSASAYNLPWLHHSGLQPLKHPSAIPIQIVCRTTLKCSADLEIN